MGALETAIAIAAKAHAGQSDKAGQPYILHSLRVMLAVEGDSERIAAVLHDVLEGCTVTVDQLIAARIPTECVAAVVSLTRRADESYDAFIERTAKNPIARRVKLADIRDNLSPARAASCAPDLRARYENAWFALEGNAHSFSAGD